jgi:hypothetical protein
VKAQDHPGLVAVLLFIVGVQKKCQCGAVSAGGRLDDLGSDVLLRLLVVVTQLFTAVRLVLSQIEVPPIRDPLQLSPTPRVTEFDVVGAARVVGISLRNDFPT